mgnify:CR=1 FL=1
MSSKNGQGADRRKHPRFTVVRGMVEPITVNFDLPGKRDKNSPKRAPRNQPALLTDLSAGGMSLILFLEPPKSKRLDMVINIPGLDAVPIEGKIVRVSQKGETFRVGIAFTKISKKHQVQIDEMAQNNMDCDTRVELNLPDACIDDCGFHSLCAKPQKVPRSPRRR